MVLSNYLVHLMTNSFQKWANMGLLVDSCGKPRRGQAFGPFHDIPSYKATSNHSCCAERPAGVIEEV